MAADLDVEVVGREFVRQYYTVLNQRPDCLHQFFTRDSSFVHGGVEKPGEEQPACQGQAVIHQKILSLNFRDCHTKIRQVDCQKTVGNAVLVQVSGELSNNGEPMRKFMQSFVLVQQAPKNFYVHNDIFRYQDEVFHDYHYAPPTPAQEPASIDETFVNHEVTTQEEVESVEIHQHASTVQESISNGKYSPIKEQMAGVPMTHSHENVSVPVVSQLESFSLNGSLQEAVQVLQTTEQQDEKVVVVQEPVVKTEEVLLENGGTKEVFEEKPAQAQPQQQKFFSWANMASKNAYTSSPSATPQGKPQAAIKPERKSEIAPVANQAAPTLPTGTTTLTAPGPKNQGGAPQPRGQGSNERKWSPEGEEGGFRSPSSFVPDNQQLFIGNLPHSITDQEVRELFEKFGNVIDIKINRKGASRDLPNFGFVAFDNHEAVGMAMKAKPILLHGKRRINIEEKKDQTNVGNGPRRIPARGGRGGTRGGTRTNAPRTNGGNPPNQSLVAESEE